MPPKRGDSSAPFQIATRSNTTPVTLPSLRGGTSRLTFNLPVSATAVSRGPNMALPQDLVDALRNLTTAKDQDRLAAQTPSTQLLNALDQQRAQSANLVQQLANNAAVAPAAAVPTLRIAAAAVESIPCFEDKLMDLPQDFVDFVDRVTVAEGWTDAQRIQVAARRLLKTALDWHIHTGHTHATWDDWSGAFTTNFSPRLHVGEWLRLVEERREKVDESGIEYALDKHKLLRVAPILLNDEKMVAFLIDGLVNWQHVAAMTANRPANVTEFIQQIRALETLGVASRVFHPPIAPPVAPPTAPPAAAPETTNTPPVPDLNATLTAFGNQLGNQLTAQFNKMAIGSRGAGRRGGGVSGGDCGGGSGGWVDPSKRKCYKCGVVGPISRHCQTKSGKVEAGKLKVPVLNMQTSSFNLRHKDLLAFVDSIDADAEKTIIIQEDQPDMPACAFSHPEEANVWKDARVGENLSAAERDAVFRVLTRLRRCFPPADGNLGSTFMTEHAIDTGDARPISYVPYRVSSAEKRIITEKIAEMLKQGINRPSFSPWAAPVVLVKKKSGDYKFCVDYRRLNAITKRDVYPLPRMDDVFDRIAGAKFFSSIDLMSGYWQVPVAEADTSKTAFVIPDGLYEFIRLPFGLNNAPSTFQRLMDRMLTRLKWQMCLVYLDDVLVFGKSFEEHQERLNCHIINENGIRPDPAKISSLVKFKVNNIKSLRAFLGLASFYRRFVPEFASLSHPLHVLLKKNAAWKWTDAQEAAKEELPGRPWSCCDARRRNWTPTNCNASRKLNDAEMKYHANELECLAIVWALKKFRSYVYGRRFSVLTDSSAVRWLWSKKEVSGKFARWILALQEFDFEIRHVKGVNNLVADALSRNPDESCIGPSDSEIGNVVCVLDSRKPTGMNSTELAFQQQLESQLRPIINWLKADAPGEVSENFKLYRKVLYKRNPSQGRKFLLCVPSILRRKIIEFCHDDPFSSHMGVDKTIARVSERYWWPKFRKRVRKHVLSCNYCQFHKCVPGFPAGQLQPIPPPDRPFHTVGMDHLGLFNATSGGKKYILMCIDYLTKYVEAASVADTTSALVVESINENINFCHGGTTRIISDQGTAFFSHLMEEKRVNRIIAQALAAYDNTDHDDWDRHLPAAVFAINTARQSTVEILPFQLVYGRLPFTALENHFPWPKGRPKPFDIFLVRVGELRQAAGLNIVKKPEKSKRLVDLRRLIVRDLRPVEDLPVKRHKKRFRRFNAHVVQIRKFHSREDVEWDDWLDEPDENAIQQPAEDESLIAAPPVRPVIPPVNPPEAVETPPQPTRTRSGRTVTLPKRFRD
ncbi:Uncharacterized protein APZ42_028400 [Daphnia magna]|uniref:RNA-directed DNA polymerase n=1 Tax=Daphnia magna TaxID=35525 RepID=A0A164QS52_9CRUS|nr:Uncharacterized protein APZ42_028400 [Daphnia magna]